MKDSAIYDPVLAPTDWPIVLRLLAEALNSPCAASVITTPERDTPRSLGVVGITPDDLPDNKGIYNRDYPGEHSRRVIVLDIQKLLRARTLVKCGAPPVDIDAHGFITKITAANNGAEDCPTVTGTLNLDSPENDATHGGPHFLAFDHETRRVAAANYFVQLTPFTLPGLHEAGDDRVCIARLTHTGQLGPRYGVQGLYRCPGAPPRFVDRATIGAVIARYQRANGNLTATLLS